MIDIELRHQNLLFGLASTFMLSSMGAAAFHVRWHSEAGPTELLGWSMVLMAAILSLAHITLDRYTAADPNVRQNAFIGTVAGSSIMATVPFALVEHILINHEWAMSRPMTFNILFIIVLVLSFVLAAGIYMAIEQADSGENAE